MHYYTTIQYRTKLPWSSSDRISRNKSTIYEACTHESTRGKISKAHFVVRDKYVKTVKIMHWNQHAPQSIVKAEYTPKKELSSTLLLLLMFTWVCWLGYIVIVVVGVYWVCWLGYIVTLRNPCGSVLFLVDVSVCLSICPSVNLSVCPDFSVLSSVRIVA